MKRTEKRLSLYLNDELIHEIQLPSFQALNTVVSDTDSEIIIKMVNMAEREDEIKVELDCDVSDEYKSYILTGDKLAENSFEKPENVHDVEGSLVGAARDFIYKAPSFSVNVLRLTKKRNN